MKYLTITSKENPLIKALTKLNQSSKERQNAGLFLVEGLRLCQDCFENNILFETLVFTKDFMQKFSKETENFSGKSKQAVIVPDYIFEKIADTKTPQGVLATVKIPNNKYSINKNGRYIALENIADPANLGAISRTAEALGISGIIISGGSCDPYSPKCIRASMGALLRLPIIVSDNFLSDLKNSGLSLYACVVKGDKKINSVNFSDGSVVLIGNEANGLKPETAEACEKITIPMQGRVESLNASVAAAVAMWELIR